MPAPNKPTVLLSCVLGLFVTIALFAFSSLSKADAKLDDDKVDQTVYDQYVETEKIQDASDEARWIRYEIKQDKRWEKFDDKLDKALGIE